MNAEPVREWVGGRLRLPANVESMGDRHPEMSLWVELPELQVVGQVLEDPLDPQASFGQSLMRAMSAPLVGEPRRPQRVRVADAELAEQLEGFSFLDVEVAPTPEFDEVVRSLAAQAPDVEFPPRALTLDDTPNPYGLPLERSELEFLEGAIGEFTLHRVLGLFCAVASVPELPQPGAWLGEIMQHASAANEAQARRVLDLLMRVYTHVISTVEQEPLDGLVPESADEEACAEWARGYTTLLGGVDPAHMQDDVLDSAFAIQTLAEIPQMLELLDEIREEESRETMLAGYRESLADDADVLFYSWGKARAELASRPAEATIRRRGSKVGRNDPCPCGSGKKFKKCCA